MEVSLCTSDAQSCACMQIYSLFTNNGKDFNFQHKTLKSHRYICDVCIILHVTEYAMYVTVCLTVCEEYVMYVTVSITVCDRVCNVCDSKYYCM